VALLVSGLAALGLAAGVVCLFGVTDYDEGGYAYGGWLVWTQGWVPYRDFFTRVPPLLYYVYGLPQALFGPSLLVARLTSVAFSLGALGFAMVVARWLAGAWAAVLTLWLFVASLVVVSYHCHALALGVTGCCLAGALCALTWERQPVAGAYLGATATALALLCRHDLLPMAVVAWSYLLLWHPAPLKHRLAALVLSLGLLVAVLLPLYQAAPDAVSYMLTVGRAAPPDVRPQAFMISGPVDLHSVARSLRMWGRYRVWVLALFAAAALLAGRRGWAGGGPAHRRGTLLALAMGSAHVVASVSAIVVLRYSPATILYPFEFWPLAVAAAVLFARAAAGVASRQRWTTATVVALLLLALARAGWGPHVWVSFARPTILAQVATGARFVAQHTSPTDRIFTVDDPHQFLQARRLVLPELFEVFFNFRDSRSTGRLERLHLFNQELIHRWLSGEANVAVVSAHSLDWVRSSGRYAGGEALFQLIQADLARHYDLVAEAEGTYGGPTRVYRLKPPPAP
jgi:hypothetical protein